MRARLLAAVVATTVGLAFWWSLTEPLPIPPLVLLAIPAAILFCCGVIAGRLGAIASPVGLLFSLFVGSIIATQMHQVFDPEAEPVSSFGNVISLSFPELIAPLAAAGALGVAGGLLGERLVQRERT